MKKLIGGFKQQLAHSMKVCQAVDLASWRRSGKMIRVCLFFLCLSPFPLRAQNFEKINKKVEKLWEGTILFNNGDELTCDFVYNPLVPEGLLVVKTDSTTNVYGVTVVRSFSFYDQEVNAIRYFYSLPVKHKQGEVIRKYFFELIHGTNQISILGRNTISSKRNRLVIANGSKYFNYDENYLLDHRDNTIYKLSKSEIIRMTKDKMNEIDNFIERHQLGLGKGNLQEYIELLNFYNSL